MSLASAPPTRPGSPSRSSVGQGATDFLSTGNVAGQTLLRLAARGNAILAELLRLSDHIPVVFREAATLEAGSAEAAQVRKYAEVVIDFRYLKQSEFHEHRIESSGELLELDHEFRENHLDILRRFYNLFESIYVYATDFVRFLEELDEGVFIQQTLESILTNTDGKQLMAEVIYLYGVQLTLLDQRIEGVVRERMLISYLRYKGTSEVPLLDEVCSLCAATGYSAATGKRPAQYPEAFFARIRLPEAVVKMVIARLRTDDIYNQIGSAFPLPEHRSTALANQAAMLYVILYFAPDILQREQAHMREIVDKHFVDNWMLSYYLGYTVDLTLAWDGYKAAKAALAQAVSPASVRELQFRFGSRIAVCRAELRRFLTEGVLTEDFVLDNVQKLIACLRECNVTIRWLLLHSNADNKKLRDIVLAGGPPTLATSSSSSSSTASASTAAAPPFDAEALLVLMLETAQFEFVLKNIFQALLNSKQAKWDAAKGEGAERMRELAEYFTGEKPLTRVKRNENLQRWFNDIADKVATLDFLDSTLAGRKIQQLTAALESVEQFEEIEGSLQVKQFLRDTRTFLREMIRIVNIKEEYLVVMMLVGDLSYGWQLMELYVPAMQARIKADPAVVLLLRATFLKLTSVMQLPLVRIGQAASPDLFSVSEYYSGQLVAYVRKVLAVIPRSMFVILRDIIELQTNQLQELPTKIEKERLKDASQPEQRFRLAHATYQVSVFTEGILAMETTLVGIIKVDPRQLLEDGIRKELVLTIATLMDRTMVFPRSTAKDPGGGSAGAAAAAARTEEFEALLRQLAARLDGLRRSFQYIQDYVNIFGLKIWQEEFSRIVNFNVEQECNSFLKKKIYDWQSQYQSVAIPIPVFQQTPGGGSGGEASVNFIGRLAREIIAQTDCRRTIFLEQMSGWYDGCGSGRELVGLRTFTLLLQAVGVFGVRGLDRLLSFMVVKELQQWVAARRREAEARADCLQLEAELQPPAILPTNAQRLYAAALGARSARVWPACGEALARIGQMQLIRRALANVLAFSCKLDSNMLFCALEVANTAVITDIQAHYAQPERHRYPADDNPLLPEMAKYLETAGISDPFSKIYITAPPLDAFAATMFVCVLSQLPRYQYTPSLAVMVARSANKTAHDITPLVVGVITTLRQFHASHTDRFLAYLGQFVRANINAAVAAAAAASKLPPAQQDLPADVQAVLLFIEQYCKYSATPRSAVESYLPPYILDA